MVAPPPRLLVGSDVGGTFTDTVLLDTASGRSWSTKIPTRARHQEESVIAGIRELLQRRLEEQAETQAATPDTLALHHGTTTATNALLEGRGARTAFLTNTGFEDLIAIRRQDRPHLYDLDVVRPAPLVPRALRIGLPYRRGPDGEDWRDAAAHGEGDERVLEDAIARLRAQGIEAVAIGFLHADLHPDDEARVAAAVREALPAVTVCASHEVWPEFREVERFETTIMNALLAPIMTHYLARLDQATREASPAGKSDVHIMDSAATLRPLDAARRLPASLLLSGPAGGVRAAISLTQALPGEPHDSLVTLDMGGTSTDVALVSGDTPQLGAETHIGGHACAFPAASIHTLGAGGGSVLWRDSGGHLQVGPRSQGARPGPACYGLGGKEATLTDAFLLTGRMPASLVLAGRTRLHRDAAHRAMERLAGSLRLDATQAAIGAIRLAVAAIASGVRVITSARGHDPRTATLMAFGGAGGLIAAELADALDMRTVLVPGDAGTLSARGMLQAPRVARTALGLRQRLAATNTGEDPALAHAFDTATEQLAAEPGATGGPVAARAALRYTGQSHELEIQVERALSVAEIRARFHAAHQATYGHAHEDRDIEVIRLVMERIAAPPRLTWQEDTAPVEPPPGLPATTPLLLSNEHGTKEIEARVAWRASLAPGQHLPGPVVIAEAGATTYVPPGWAIHVEATTGTLRMQREPGGEGWMSAAVGRTPQGTTHRPHEAWRPIDPPA